MPPASPDRSWPYTTSGIPDDWFAQLPGIPLTKREVRLLILAQLRLEASSCLWDVGAGTGTIPVEAGLLCPKGKVIAIERDEEVCALIQRNCQQFAVSNVDVVMGTAPDCLAAIAHSPDRAVIEGGRPIATVISSVWQRLQPQGRLVVTTASLEGLYTISETLAQLPARNIEVVQAAMNRLERRGRSQVLAAVDPIFILSGEKLE
ncbi:precorrin-6Y C5,15-methyltransferase subunit CbiT [Synechococcus elongatus]|uniref:Precorrin decarbocylase n=1 Tax=Synechococcus elongatus (strain ATCC 33912 / PCC 7942 / FACHB-805) TaxID=1140 RepID=Q31QD1_SYNE7|nr:precorrin-6Y C5,15-methyltransferase subunit CbiT [Synechococcus elongatus]ABB56738.1 precorrin decarbocylase [Synechococcus elongatus PCC 7942 = FACHB-805]AJD58721.1 precorrin-6B methylase [Synechococcus elongatus UTEX 2973]MBD2588598.1 precorrin-6Y C5,15-methyltransferase subunit CbiT [Synechococcus elongatus FACHB-242]MBD2689813.1 precorrin-6Y C5,15-methyltransferase subunit CbiT [Synechococcus elongatus FACHB-1061]MBD2708420.1 precorrin-6Y C5,15-methyltransferase subunit CbiT [Synechoco